MNQPQNPIPPRGVRPQLFAAPAGKKPHANAQGHADFGPSILATIDGGQSRIASSRDRSALKRVLLLSVLALVAAAVYVGLKFSTARASADPQVVAAAPVAKPVTAKTAEVAAPAASQAATQGAAAIETVASVADAASAAVPVSEQAANVTTSIGGIQQTLDRSEPAPTKKEKAVSKSAQPTRTATSTASAQKPGARKSAAQADTDADLLAAMLPHIARGPGTPSSPAFERRCGQLTGVAVVDCKAKFCNGREGVDAACPAPAQSP